MFYQIPIIDTMIDFDYKQDIYTQMVVQDECAYIQFADCTVRQSWEEITEDFFQSLLPEPIPEPKPEPTEQEIINAEILLSLVQQQQDLIDIKDSNTAIEETTAVLLLQAIGGE